MNNTVLAIAKAITGAVIAFLAALTTAVQSNGIDAGEWITAASVFFVALAAVYTVPNAVLSTVLSTTESGTTVSQSKDELSELFEPGTEPEPPEPEPGPPEQPA